MKYRLGIGIARYIFNAVSMMVTVATEISALHSVEHGHRRWIMVALGISTVFSFYLDQIISITNHRTDMAERFGFNTLECPPNTLSERWEYNSTGFLLSTNKRASLSRTRYSQGLEIAPEGLIREKFEPVTYTNDTGNFSWFVMKEPWILRMWGCVGLDFGNPGLNSDWTMLLIAVQGGDARTEEYISIDHFYTWWSGLVGVMNRTEDQRRLSGDGSWNQAAKDVMKIVKEWTKSATNVGIFHDWISLYVLHTYMATKFNILAYDFQVLIWNTLGTAESKRGAAPCYNPIREQIGVVMSRAKRLSRLIYLRDILFWGGVGVDLFEKINNCLDTKDCRTCQEHSSNLEEGKKSLTAWLDMKYGPIGDLHDILFSQELSFLDETVAQNTTTEGMEAHSCSKFTILTSVARAARADIEDWRETEKDDMNAIMAEMDEEKEALISNIKRFGIGPNDTSPFRAHCGEANISILEGYVAFYNKDMKPSGWNSGNLSELAQNIKCFVIGHAKLLEAINYFTIFDGI
jgi:hypothetical protein